jgi:hypothetical protein
MVFLKISLCSEAEKENVEPGRCRSKDFESGKTIPYSMTAVLDRFRNLWVVDGSELPLVSLACKENSDDIRNSTETRWGRGEAVVGLIP